MALNLDDFSYDLPEEQIAKYPLADRSDSKLLIYNKGTITHDTFKCIPSLLPEGSLLVFNDTKVIPARIILSKETGARIEIFLLDPLNPNTHEEIMATKKSCVWQCMIGNAKKWPVGSVLEEKNLKLIATRSSETVVHFQWNSELSFSELLMEIGKIPLPPYLNRETEVTDEERYQTVYSKHEGAVAAPTAGLHFTDEVLKELQIKGVETDYLTLHVSSGTFQPIKEKSIKDHPMHNEKVWVTSKNIEGLLAAKKIIAVGTTAMRTLESLYWYGAKLETGETKFSISKNDPYEKDSIPTRRALENVLNYMKSKDKERLGGQTEIFLYPGYSFKLCNGLVTNYHLPKSTLILLIAAFIGEDWRRVYNEALDYNYRFLSYGDSSLLIP